MDDHRGSSADLHSITAKRKNTELCDVLLCCVSGAGLRFKIGPSSLIERHKRDKTDGKHRKNEDSSKGCEEATPSVIGPSTSRREQWNDFIRPKDQKKGWSGSLHSLRSRTRWHHDVNRVLVVPRVTVRSEVTPLEGTFVPMCVCLRSRVNMAVTECLLRRRAGLVRRRTSTHDDLNQI